MSGKSRISRRFPHIGWAWPDGGRHQLILAAICPDEDRAFAAIESWLRSTDLDDATFAEHRLLAAITTRFHKRLAPHPEYARLCGLQRLNWTRSRMAIDTCKPVLEKMVEKGLKVILLKGACRVALDMSEQKSRTSYDLDLLFDGADFDAAFEILAADGWASTRGESTFGLRARLSSVRARNFKKGKFGDIDIHRYAYHTASSNGESDMRLFDDLQPVTFYGLKAFIPGPEERLAMAIGHGGWDGQSHSDWLVDAARIIETGELDWGKFKRIIADRRLKGTAAIALSYLDTDASISIPKCVLSDLRGATGFPWPSQLEAMLLVKETKSLSGLQKFARGCVVNYRRLWHSGRDRSQDAAVFRALGKAAPGAVSADYALNQSVALPARMPGTWQFSLTVTYPAPKRRRRIELEINSQTRNLCHLQTFQPKGMDGAATARFRGEITIDPSDMDLVVNALPGKLIEDGPGSADHEKYGAIPFLITGASFRFKQPVDAAIATS